MDCESGRPLGAEHPDVAVPLGAEHPDVAVPLGNLGDEYAYLGRIDEALPLHRRALSVLEKSLGNDHASVVTALQSLGYDYELSEDWERALPFYARSYQIRRDTFGDEHRTVAEAAARLGLTELELGAPSGARPVLELARKARLALDDDPYALAEVDFALARALAKEDPARAETLAHAARKTFAEDESTAEELAAVDAWLAARP